METKKTALLKEEAHPIEANKMEQIRNSSAPVEYLPFQLKVFWLVLIKMLLFQNLTTNNVKLLLHANWH